MKLLNRQRKGIDQRGMFDIHLLFEIDGNTIERKKRHKKQNHSFISF